MEEKVGFPDRAKQRFVVFVFFFLSGVLTATWSSRIPDVQNRFHLSNAQLGTVLFAIPVGMIAGLGLAPWLVVRFGNKRILLSTCILCALCLLFASMVSVSWALMIVLFFLGLGRTIYNLAANTSALEVQQFYEKPIMSRFHGVWSLACLIAAGVGALLLLLFDLSLVLHFTVAALAVVLIAIYYSTQQKTSVIVTERRPFFVTPDRYLFLLGMIALCSMLCEGAMFDWSVNYFEKVIGAGKSLRIGGYISFIITMTGGRLLGDHFVHRYGAYRILMINGVFMLAGFCIAVLFPFFLPACLGFLLVGLGDSILVPLLFMLAARSKKMPAAYALSSVTLIGYTGFLIGPLFIGNISQVMGMRAAFICLAFLSLGIIILSRLTRQVMPS